MAIEIPARLGYAGGNLKGLHRVLEEIVDAVESSSGSVVGCDATISELNKLHDVVAGTTSASKALVVGASKEVDTLVVAALKLGANAGVAVTSSAAELNLLDNSVAGTAVASKALVLGADKDIDTIAIPVSGLKIGAGAGTAVTASAAELNVLKSAVAGTAVPSKAAVLGTSHNLDVLGLPVSGLKVGAAGAEVVVTTSAAEMNILKGVTAVAADLNKVAATSAGTASANKAAILGANKNLDEFHTASLYLGAGAGTAVTATAAELNAVTAMVAGTASPQVFDVTATRAQVNAGATAIVPAVSGKQFIALDAWMVAIGGDPSASTLIRLKEETSNGVVLSHPIADFASAAWVGKSGGTGVTTLLATPLVANKAILIDQTGTALATATSIRAVVVGFYV
jgi:hypothetical protein